MAHTLSQADQAAWLREFVVLQDAAEHEEEAEEEVEASVGAVPPDGLWVTPRKPFIQVSDLKPRQRDMYNTVVSHPLFEEALLWLKTHASSVSGRLLNSLMTTYPKTATVLYHLDVTDPVRPIYVASADVAAAREAKRPLRLCDLSAEYRTRIGLYTKTYFDTFGRGAEVLHPWPPGADGRERFIAFPLCKLMFALFVLQFRVVDFLHDHHNQVHARQRHDQRLQRRKRRKKRRSPTPPPAEDKPAWPKRHRVALCSRTLPVIRKE